MQPASEVDIEVGVGMVELALVRMPLWKIIHLMEEWPVSGQSCQLASEEMVKFVCGTIQCWWHMW
jgi:hypothetical protein